jgi:hypothetical protein
MMTRDELMTTLKENVAVVSFTKKDGTEREMRCTLQESMLPPVFLNGTEQMEQKVRKQNPDVVSVWDLDKSAWRSFRLDSVKTVSV